MANSSGLQAVLVTSSLESMSTLAVSDSRDSRRGLKESNFKTAGEEANNAVASGSLVISWQKALEGLASSDMIDINHL